MKLFELIVLTFEGRNHMARESREPEDAALQRQRSLARWDNEGGAMASGSQVEPGPADQAISIHAAEHMVNLMERAERFRSCETS